MCYTIHMKLDHVFNITRIGYSWKERHETAAVFPASEMAPESRGSAHVAEVGITHLGNHSSEFCTDLGAMQI